MIHYDGNVLAAKKCAVFVKCVHYTRVSLTTIIKLEIGVENSFISTTFLILIFSFQMLLQLSRFDSASSRFKIMPFYVLYMRYYHLMSRCSENEPEKKA